MSKFAQIFIFLLHCHHYHHFFVSVQLGRLQIALPVSKTLKNFSRWRLKGHIESAHGGGYLAQVENGGVALGNGEVEKIRENGENNPDP